MFQHQYWDNFITSIPRIADIKDPIKIATIAMSFSIPVLRLAKNIDTENPMPHSMAPPSNSILFPAGNSK